jgi:hypothetical protein
LAAGLLSGNSAQSQDRAEKISLSEPAKSFVIAETLEYSVEWLGIPVGKIVMKVEGLTEVNNHQCYHITAQVLPNNFFRHFYDLEYKVNTYIDQVSFLPVRFEKVRRLNKKTNYVTIDFDHRNNEAHYKSWGSTLFVRFSPLRQKLEMINPTTSRIIPGSQDLFSSFYYFRILKIKEGASYPVNIYYNQRNWSLKMFVDRPFIKEIRKKGSIAVVKLSPVSELNNYILGRRKFYVYVTVDSRRIPIEFGLNTAVGYIRGIIQNLPK